MGTDDEIIDLVESVDLTGQRLWIDPNESAQASTGLLNAKDGQIIHGGQPVSAIPRERFAANSTSSELAQMIQQIREAEAGRNASEIAVQPDGKITPSRPGQHQVVASTVPRERFAASPRADEAEIHRLDPHHECDWRWHDSARGWTFKMNPDVFSPSEYAFLVRQEPSRRNEWFAYCLSPNLDHFVGHRHHLQRLDDLTVVCLRPGFRGHRTLGDTHGALAKWCIYMEFIRRGLNPPFSE